MDSKERGESAGKPLSKTDLDACLEILESRFAAIVRREVAEIFELNIMKLQQDMIFATRDTSYPESENFLAGQAKIKQLTSSTGSTRIYTSEQEERNAPSPPTDSKPCELVMLETAPRISPACSSHFSHNDEEYLEMARTKTANSQAVAPDEAGEEEEPRCACRRHLQAIVNTGYFELFWFVVILGNAVLLGCQVEMVALGLAVDSDFRIPDAVFTSLFLLELLLRLVSEGCIRSFFCRSRNRWWHLFDAVIVTCTVIDLFLTVFLGSVIDKARAFRLLRLMRILRAARSMKVVQYIAPLRMLLESMIGTFRTLLWAMVLLLIMTFVCAIVLTDAISSSLEDPSLEMQSLRFFRDLSSAMLVLFWSVMGGTDCWVVQEELIVAGGAWVYIFALYNAFSIFAVLNVMTAIFCQSAMERAGKDHELVVSALSANRAALDGAIALDDLEARMKGEGIQDFFSALEIEVSDVVTLFRLLDRTGDGLVDSSEFVEGCLKLRGNAKAIDVTAIKFDVKGLRTQIAELSQVVQKWAETPIKQEPRAGGTGAGHFAQRRAARGQSVVVAM